MFKWLSILILVLLPSLALAVDPPWTQSPNYSSIRYFYNEWTRQQDGVYYGALASSDSQRLGGQLPAYYAVRADVKTSTTSLQNQITGLTLNSTNYTLTNGSYTWTGANNWTHGITASSMTIAGTLTSGVPLCFKNQGNSGVITFTKNNNYSPAQGLFLVQNGNMVGNGGITVYDGGYGPLFSVIAEEYGDYTQGTATQFWFVPNPKAIQQSWGEGFGTWSGCEDYNLPGTFAPDMDSYVGGEFYNRFTATNPRYLRSVTGGFFTSEFDDSVTGDIAAGGTFQAKASGNPTYRITAGAHIVDNNASSNLGTACGILIDGIYTGAENWELYAAGADRQSKFEGNLYVDGLIYSPILTSIQNSIPHDHSQLTSTGTWTHTSIEQHIGNLENALLQYGNQTIVNLNLSSGTMVNVDTATYAPGIGLLYNNVISNTSTVDAGPLGLTKTYYYRQPFIATMTGFLNTVQLYMYIANNSYPTDYYNIAITNVHNTVIASTQAYVSSLPTSRTWKTISFPSPTSALTANDTYYIRVSSMSGGGLGDNAQFYWNVSGSFGYPNGLFQTCQSSAALFTDATGYYNNTGGTNFNFTVSLTTPAFGSYSTVFSTTNFTLSNNQFYSWGKFTASDNHATVSGSSITYRVQLSTSGDNFVNMPYQTITKEE